MAISERNKQADVFILHSRPYQESSAILQVFSPQVGRFSVIAKGIRNKKSMAKKATLQPFRLINLIYTGKSDLKTLVDCQTGQVDPQDLYFSQTFLACGYYLNELILRALPEWESFPDVFESYQKALTCLKTDDMASTLRNFEVSLLTHLGIAPDWLIDATNQPIKSSRQYSFIDDKGFVVAEQEPHFYGVSSPVYSGKAILALADGDFQKVDVKESQRLTQRLLRQVIGDKPLQSRKLWQHNRQKKQ